MAATLHLPKEGDVHAALAGLEAACAPSRKRAGEMATANSLWPDKSSAPSRLPRTPAVNTTGPRSPRRISANAGCRLQTINDWVANRTAGRIQNLILPGVIDALTRMVLVNAIYFKGDWAARFDPAQTSPGPFFATDGEREVPLMHRRGSIRHAATDTLQLVELPYAGGDLSMLVLLPRDRGGLPALEAALNAENFAEWTRALRPRDVKLWLPRFKVRRSSLAQGHADRHGHGRRLRRVKGRTFPVRTAARTCSSGP
ncbi:MAG: serpin family protein [Kiritimatiellia bacterium]